MRFLETGEAPLQGNLPLPVVVEKNAFRAAQAEARKQQGEGESQRPKQEAKAKQRQAEASRSRRAGQKSRSEAQETQTKNPALENLRRVSSDPRLLGGCGGLGGFDGYGQRFGVSHLDFITRLELAGELLPLG